MNLDLQEIWKVIRKKLPVILMAAAALLLLISVLRFVRFAKKKAWYPMKTTGTVIGFNGASKAPVFEYKDEYGFDREYTFEGLGGQYVFDESETLYRNTEFGEMCTSGQLYHSMYAGIGWLTAALLFAGAGILLYQYDCGKLRLFPRSENSGEKTN